MESSPPGAQVQQDSITLGTTPALILIPRSSRDPLILTQGTTRKSVPLTSTYRWTDSFFSNFAFLTYAPIGWVIDLFTGAAFQIKDPPPVTFEGNLSTRRRTQEVLIAPPFATTLSQSSEAAHFWNKQLPTTQKDLHFRDFDQTIENFLKIPYDFDSSQPNQSQLRDLLFDSQADLIFSSSVTVNPTGLRLEGQYLNARGETNRPTEKALIPAPPSFVQTKLGLANWNRWIEFIPNYFGLESSTARNNLLVTDQHQNGIDYYSERINDRSVTGTALSYLEGINIGYLQPPRLDRSLRFRALLVPNFQISYRHFFYPELNELALVDFRYFRTSGGIGPEAGWLWGRSYAYFKIIALLSYHSIQWDQPGGSQEQNAGTSLDSLVELGYLYYFNEKLSLRIFSRSTSTGTDRWNEVTHRINPTLGRVSTASDQIAGIAFGYIFDFRQF